MWLRGEGQSVSLCLTFDYGQRSYQAESRAARGLAERHGLPWQSVELPWLAAAARRAGCSLLSGELPVGTLQSPGDAASAASVWVPARNVVFLSVGAAFAEAGGDAVVLTGFNREEAATFPDNSAQFVASMDGVLELGTRTAVRVEAPTIAMIKSEIVAAARGLDLAAGDFWSCYAGGSEPCGTCESCLRSERAWSAGDHSPRM